MNAVVQINFKVYGVTYRLIYELSFSSPLQKNIPFLIFFLRIVEKICFFFFSLVLSLVPLLFHILLSVRKICGTALLGGKFI